MQGSLQRYYETLLPKSIRYKISIYREGVYLRKLRKLIIKYLESLKIRITIEQEEVLKYLQSNPVSVFPYEFQKDYDQSDITVFKDSQNGLHYIIAEDKRLYFKRSWKPDKIRQYYNTLRIEQDIKSPHRYLTDDFNLGPNDIIADIGIAEGNFTLNVIETIKFAYLFETDSEWIEAINATFQPWKDKIQIINKFVANSDENGSIKLDSFFNDIEVATFLKIDVDGAESDLLAGSLKLLTNFSPLKVAICTYHGHNDEEEFSALLSSMDFSTKHSDGYMVFYNFRDLAPPYLRRGLIRAIKN